MSAWLLLVPAVLILAAYLLAFALCAAARRGDDMAERARERERDRWHGWHT